MRSRSFSTPHRIFSEKKNSEIVQTDILDNYTKNLNKNNSLIFIHAEGHEPYILLGSKKTIQKKIHIIIEFYPKLLDKNRLKNFNLAFKNCKKIMKLTKCDAVKIEGGLKIIKIIKHLIKNKIPVMGHVGILPQTTRGKFKSKGKSIKERNQLIRDCMLIEKAGAFSIVLECVQRKLAMEISNSIKIPTIGIGSSNNCDGQILVIDDVLGFTDSKMKFVKKFIDLKKIITNAAKKFNIEVKSKRFPTKKHSY